MSWLFLGRFTEGAWRDVPPQAHSPRDLCLCQVAELHQSLLSLDTDLELLRAQLSAVSQEKLSQAQDVTELQKKLRDAETKVE